MEEDLVELTIRVPRSVHDDLAGRIADTEFQSLADYIAYVVTELAQEETLVEPAEADDEATLERLRALGYVE